MARIPGSRLKCSELELELDRIRMPHPPVTRICVCSKSSQAPKPPSPHFLLILATCSYDLPRCRCLVQLACKQIVHAAGISVSFKFKKAVAETALQSD